MYYQRDFPVIAAGACYNTIHVAGRKAHYRPAGAAKYCSQLDQANGRPCCARSLGHGTISQEV